MAVQIEIQARSAGTELQHEHVPRRLAAGGMGGQAGRLARQRAGAEAGRSRERAGDEDVSEGVQCQGGGLVVAEAAEWPDPEQVVERIVLGDEPVFRAGTGPRNRGTPGVESGPGGWPSS